MIDGRAAAQKKIADNNIKRVAKWIEDNPNGTREDCKKELELSYWTVCRIIKELKIKANEIEVE